MLIVWQKSDKSMSVLGVETFSLPQFWDQFECVISGLPPRCKWDLCSSGTLRGVILVLTDVSTVPNRRWLSIYDAQHPRRAKISLVQTVSQKRIRTGVKILVIHTNVSCYVRQTPPRNMPQETQQGEKRYSSSHFHLGRVGGQRHSPAALPPGKSPGAQSGRVWKREKSLAPNGTQTLGRLETKRTAIPNTLFQIPTVT